ncbi:uncharacterized protein LOC111802125 [Cucurbita pepo subsp. pepo]|uniref:Uncharacterized protein LOC111456713 n=1 Tax=Cucurbita moschata TaxID=3662 RepID=A0A6J1GT11_CUCMO|nr:uncharacterized protein LOC111456713 [Cucurbita moschata]XP_023542159.1 uncharacterized protein LOC111802125 [Cucurbita pepo subsp. pepo]
MAIPSQIAAFAAVYCFLAAIFFFGCSNARDLRPSEHGLEYQNPGATGNSSSNMQSFFQGNSWSSSEVELPKAVNTSLPSQWWNRSHANRSGAGGDHIRGALIVVSLVCGIIGFSLLIASAFIYFFKFKKQNSRSPSSLSASETASIIVSK